jgi:thiamine-monophosphate kinase
MKLYEDKTLDPTVISSCEEFNLDSTTVALSGGEDYELLFTVKQEDFLRLGKSSLFIVATFLPQSDGIHLVTRGGQQILSRQWGGTVLN